MAQNNPLRSDFNPQLITSSNVDGKVRIVDPNPLGEIVPHEELYIYVNLTADQRSRSVLTETGGKVSIENEIKNTVNLAVPQQTTNIGGQELFGPVYNLSTDWTEIGGPGNKQLGKDFEGFGITNIDIEIKSQTTPKVVIDFVDVRGATLMEQGSCSPYGLFFNLPYPIFYLTVKGYYGKPVKYYLNLTKFNCKFNSETGNMECRGEFIGWSFAFLSDIIVSYVQASQYLDNGKYNQSTYLREIYEKTWDFYQKNNIVPKDSKNIFCDNPAFNTPCCTLKDLLFSLDKLNKTDLPDVKGSTEFTKLQNLTTLKTAYDSYSEAVFKLFGKLDSDKLPVTRVPSAAYGDNTSRYERIDINALNDDVKNILKEYFDKKSGTLSTLIGIIKSSPIEDGLYGDSVVDILTPLKKSDFDDVTSNKGLLYDNLKNKPWQWNTLDTWLKLGYIATSASGNTHGSYGFIDLGYIIQDIEIESEKINTKIDEIRNTVVGDLNEIITNRIGFNPTIRNILTVLTCNVDAFMRLLLDVSSKAEKYHDNITKNRPETKDGSQDLIQSGINKIFSWPTYFEQNYKPSNSQSQPQGTKEVYPGKKFPQWIEVRFVEDFVTAFLSFIKDLEVLNDNKENKPGFDNYVPITPLESPAFNPDARIKYYDIEPSEVNTVIGERLFVSLDHTLFQPVRLTDESVLIPPINREGQKWNPFQDSQTRLSNDVAIIDTWNFLNSQEDTSIISTTCQGDVTTFINNVIAGLKTRGKLDVDVKGSTLKKLPSYISIKNSYGFKDDELFYVYTPNEGGIKLNGTSGNEVIIKPNPYDMLDSNPDSIFMIMDATDGEGKRQLNITSDDFKSAISKYKEAVIADTPSGKQSDFGDNTVDNPSNSPTLEDKQQTITFNKSNLFTTLSIMDGSKEVTEWWKTSNLSQLNPSSMGQLTYWDYENITETYGIGFRSNPTPYDAYTWDEDNGAQGEIDVRDGVTSTQHGINDPFITSPLWVDNINNFRTAAGGSVLNDFNIYGGTTNPDSKDKVERRNLAYLFLHTLKPTPLVIRHIDQYSNFYSDTNEASDVFSIKAFNTAGGIVKVPKAWLLSLGAQLWRWKNFVGTKPNGEWNKPLSGEKPNGYDLLSQPGFNGKTGTINPDNGSTRNNFDTYLDRVYGTTINWDTRVQKSSFSNDYMSADNSGTKLSGMNGTKSEESRAAFDYYAVYQLPGGIPTSTGQKIEDNVVGKTEEFGTTWVGGPRTAQNATDKYNWPQLWIAPHHIPYVHPPVFDDEDEWEGSLYVQLFRTSIGILDYQSFMPVTLPSFNGYYEDDNKKTKNTLRDRTLDGNLGAIMQFLPDKVKDIIVTKFEEFCDGEWIDLLKIIDPVNFPTTSKSQMVDSYNLYLSDKDVNLFPSGDAGNGAFLFKNEGGPQKVRDSLMVQQYWLINSTPKIWYGIEKKEFSNSFIVSKNVFEEYLRTFHTEYQTLRPKRVKELNKTKTQEEQNLGDISLEDTDIKLSLYRTFKSLTDKWISVDSSGNQFFNVTQSANSEKCQGKNGSKSTLASHFQYVNRAMGDIGNEAVIDITKLNELKDNLKISLYQYVSDLLTDNEYMFFPLPAYIDFTADGVKDNDLKDMFRPTMSLNNVSCGPLFLSMYVGGNSRQLDLQLTANCPKDVQAIREQNLKNDSFNFSTTSTNFPSELTANNNKEQDKGYTVFKVVYGLENQNHFKNIQLDQSEFSETSESLMVIDKLAQQGGTDQTTKGQNLNSIYLTRSYTCQVESFGNMMIQPMTYFDLFGVPMFNGAYLITEVRHNIKPNHATTTFKGVRQPKATIPIVTNAAAAMTMSLKSVEARKGGGRSLSQVRLASAGNAQTGGAECGNFPVKSIPGDISNGTKFYNTKPIRDLVATVESGTGPNGYDAYNSGVAGVKEFKTNGEPFKPSTMTIGEIKAAQRATSPPRIFAVGKYQLIGPGAKGQAPDTFGNMVKALGFSDSDIFDADKQEQAGEWLIIKGAGYRKGLINYFASGSLGTEEDLQKAITDLALEFASFPSYYGPTSGDAAKYSGIIGYNSRTALYGGSAGNPARSNFCAQDVAKALIQTWKNLNPGKTPSFDYDKVVSVTQTTTNSDCSNSTPITLNTSSTSVIMGSSTVGTLTALKNGLRKSNIPIGPNCVGSTIKFLIDSLKNDTKTYTNVKVVYVAGIGTNDGYPKEDKKIKEFNDLVIQRFPNAKKVILPGTYGWGSVKDKTKTDQDVYYANFQNLGWTYEYPTCNCGGFSDQAAAHNNPESPWFSELINGINKYKPV